MIDIAKQGEAGALVTMRQAAQRQGLSVKYLEQLGGALVRAGVLKSIRGVSGGYYLAQPADQIRIGDVLRATEGSCMPVACVDDEGKCDLAGCCEARGHDHCGVCGDFVCKLLHSFAYDAEHGDGAGARLETCRRWAKGD